MEGSSELSISALGALVWYLKRANLHTQTLTRRLFTTYTPPDCQSVVPLDEEEDSSHATEDSDQQQQKAVFRQRSMVGLE